MQITIDGNEQVAAAYIGAMGTDIDKSFMISGQFSPVRICKDGVIKINLQKYDVFSSSKKGRLALPQRRTPNRMMDILSIVGDWLPVLLTALIWLTDALPHLAFYP